MQRLMEDDLEHAKAAQAASDFDQASPRGLVLVPAPPPVSSHVSWWAESKRPAPTIHLDDEVSRHPSHPTPTSGCCGSVCRLALSPIQSSIESTSDATEPVRTDAQPRTHMRRQSCPTHPWSCRFGCNRSTWISPRSGPCGHSSTGAGGRRRSRCAGVSRQVNRLPRARSTHVSSPMSRRSWQRIRRHRACTSLCIRYSCCPV